MVEVTAHGGARPEHAEWQGKVYSRSGKSKKYPSLVDKTGYGTGPGLGGWNCRHSMFPFYEGSTRAYTDEELEELKPRAQNGIIFTDSEKQALNNYISSDSYKINEKLRNNEFLNEVESKLVKDLNNALDKMPNYKGIAVRVLNIHGEKLDKFLNNNKIGNKYYPNSFQSFSTQKGYNNNSNIEIYVKSNKGKDIRKFNPEENEILFSNKKGFLVENVYKSDNKYYILWREIDE